MKLVILLAALLLPPLASAQITYTPTPGSGYLPLSGATVRGSVSVRTNNAAPPVTYVLDGVNQNTENTAPLDLYGDLTLWDTTKLLDGEHVLKAGAYTATFTISNGGPGVPTDPTWTGSQGLAWTPPTQNDDGTSLTDLAGYLIQFGNGANALTREVRVENPGARTYVVPGLAQGRWYFGIRAYNAAGAQSDLSTIIQVQITESLPACPAQPAPESQFVVCPVGTTGSWTQARTYTAAPYPTCWTQSAWLPANAPAGSCVAIPPPPATWKVRASTVGTRPAYELVRSQGDTAWVRGYKLGDIAVGKSCAIARELGSGTSEYHKVIEADVVLLSPTYRGRTLIAVCAK